MKYIFSTLLLITISSCFSQVTPPPPPPPPAASPEVFKVVEEMPRFPGCENQGLKNKELTDCSQDKMLEYIYNNLEYPETAKSNKIEGVSVVQFKIEKNGTLSGINIVRNPGSGTGEAAAALIHKMNNDGIKWIPGKQRGRVVVVQYTLPIKFALNK